MEEDSDLEHVTGSPTAGESGFVHVESINSASMDGSAIIQVILVFTNCRQFYFSCSQLNSNPSLSCANDLL